MKVSKVGTCIYKGMTTKEIRLRIKDFPEEPDIKYFEDLGYTRKTAISYKCKLKKNNLKQENQNIERQEEDEEKLKGIFLTSEKPNKNDIILDTSSLGRQETINIIEESSKVTVIYSVLNEFDSIKLKSGNNNEYLKKKIRYYSEIMLSDNEKYRLVPFKWEEKRYTDDMILEYVMQLPVKERPTILTADKNLALKAKCLGIEYIFYKQLNTTEQETTNTDNQRIIEANKDEEKEIEVKQKKKSLKI